LRLHWNGVRLYAGIGYVTPDDENEGRGGDIRKAREAGRAQARQARPAYHRNTRNEQRGTTRQDHDDVG
jgi:putative transposase